MFNWLKKHFIPHAGNDHRPHILRDRSTRNIVALVLFLELFTFLLPTLSHINMSSQMAAVLPAVLAGLTNEQRQDNKLPTLAVSPVLNQAAEMKAKDMATKGYFAHTSPEGKTPWYWLEQAGYKYQYAGENLAINFSDSKDVTTAWMNSPTHRANIVKGNYTEIGTGVASGLYEGRETIFVAQVYANPLPETAKTINIEPIPAKPSVVKKVATAQESKNVLGEQITAPSGTPPEAVAIQTTPIKPVAEPTLLQESLASPRSTMNTVLFIVFAVIAVALILYIFIRTKNYHKGLITNGLMVLAMLGAIFIVNYYWTHHDMVITQSMDYSNSNQWGL